MVIGADVAVSGFTSPAVRKGASNPVASGSVGPMIGAAGAKGETDVRGSGIGDEITKETARVIAASGTIGVSAATEPHTNGRSRHPVRLKAELNR
jgi:hypothetical protein